MVDSFGIRSRPQALVNWALGCALVCLISPQSIYGTALQQLTLAEITQDATEIVQGTVSRSLAVQSGSTIFTIYTVHVEQRMKGPVSATSTVAIPGGSLNGLRQSFPGVPSLDPGKEYLLFLWTGRSGPTQLVGLSQGVLEIGVDVSGTLAASRPASAETMLGFDHKPAVDRPVHLKLAEARQQIRAALAGHPALAGQKVQQ